MESLCLTVHISPADRDDLKGSCPKDDVNQALVLLKVMREKDAEAASEPPESVLCILEVLVVIPSHGQAWPVRFLTASACSFAPVFILSSCLQTNSRSAEADTSRTGGQ